MSIYNPHKTKGLLGAYHKSQGSNFAPQKSQPGSAIPLSLHFIFLEIIHAHKSLENQFWAQSEFTEAKGLPQKNSHFSLFW